jgi:hypothetical protein
MQDMQVIGRPSKQVFFDQIGFYTYGDLPGITELVFNQTTSIAGYDIESTNELVSVSWPNLVSVDLDNVQGGYIIVDSGAALISVSAPLLEFVNGSTDFSNFIRNCPALKFIDLRSIKAWTSFRIDYSSLPSLVSIRLDASVTFGYLEINVAPFLTDITLSSYLPTPGSEIGINGAALSEETVNQIMSRGVANPAFTTGIVQMINGGVLNLVDTMPGQSAMPTGQGIIDMRTLVARGVKVIVNSPVDWTPTNVALGEMMGFFCLNDLPGITSIEFDCTTNLAGFDIESTSQLVSLSWPYLTNIDPSDSQSGYLNITTNSALETIYLPFLVTLGGGGFACDYNSVLTSLSIPALTTIAHGNFECTNNAALLGIDVSLLSYAGTVRCIGNPSLVSLNFPALTANGADFDCSGNTSMVNFSFPSFSPHGNEYMSWNSCALNQSSVDGILAVLAAGVSGFSGLGTVVLDGGTNSPPSGAGAANAAILVAAGVTVTTN